MVFPLPCYVDMAWECDRLNHFQVSTWFANARRRMKKASSEEAEERSNSDDSSSQNGEESPSNFDEHCEGIICP